MQDDTLIVMTHELADMVKKNRTKDWDKKESVMVAMRRIVKELL